MGKTAYNAEGKVSKGKVPIQGKPVYKDMKGRKISLIIGFVLCVLAFCAVLAAVLMSLVPALTINPTSVTQFTLNTWLFGFGSAAAFLGIVMAVAGANTAKGLARFAFFLGIVAFITGFVMLIICLFFQTVLPIRVLREAAAFLPI